MIDFLLDMVDITMSLTPLDRGLRTVSALPSVMFPRTLEYDKLASLNCCSKQLEKCSHSI